MKPLCDSAREGWVECRATPLHLGKNTQVWDATVTTPDGAAIAVFRCTQMVLWPRKQDAVPAHEPTTRNP